MIERHLIDGLEVFDARPDQPRSPTPLLFVHGAHAGAWTWVDHFLPWFAGQGYRACALSLRGHGGSHQHELLHWQGIADYVDDVLHITDWLGETPVLIGHSLGGFVVQKALERRYAKGAVLMCSAPPQGMLAGQFHLMFNNPVGLIDLNPFLENSQSDPHLLRDFLFAEPIDDDTVNRYLLRLQPESHRAIWDISIFHQAGLATLQRPPMLILGAEKDRILSPFLVQSTAHTYGLPCKIFRGMGHALTHEKNWPRVAETIHHWLEKDVNGAPTNLAE